MLFHELIEIIDPKSRSGAWHMAMDEVLLRSVKVPHLRVYRWRAPAVSFGYFVDIAGLAERWPGRELVRRWTGGGVVLHGDDLTYALVVPREAEFFSIPARESYRMIHEHLVELLPGSRVAPAPKDGGSRICFEGAVEHDVIVDEKKIAGAAQRRTRDGLLHQGSIQSADATRLVAQLARAFAVRTSHRRFTAEEVAEAEKLVCERYGTEKFLNAEPWNAERGKEEEI